MNLWENIIGNTLNFAGAANQNPPYLQLVVDKNFMASWFPAKSVQ